MTLHTVSGTPRRQDEILDEFFEDVATQFGWERLGQVMEMIQVLENGQARYYIIGSRGMGFHWPESDLDILTDFGMYRDFERIGWDFTYSPKHRGPQPPWDWVGLCQEDTYFWHRLNRLAHSRSVTLDFQVWTENSGWKEVWEQVMRYHRDKMLHIALRPKVERWVGQKLILDRIAKELKGQLAKDFERIGR